jgi:copper chaperone CopZ
MVAGLGDNSAYTVAGMVFGSIVFFITKLRQNKLGMTYFYCRLKKRNYMKAKSLLLMLLFISLAYFGMTQKINEKNTVVVIKTSAQCEMCKERIVSELSMRKGVKKIDLSLETQELTVIYNGVKTSEDELREAISKIGYSADDIEASQEAYENLPNCCKKPKD